MEYEELVLLWGKFDNRLNNLERLNKKLIEKTLLKKPKRRLNFFKFKSIESMIIFPIAIFILLYPNLKTENIDGKFIIGSIFVLAILVYVIYINLKTLGALNDLNLSVDSILESARKSNKIKSIYNSRYRNARINLPIIYVGIVLIKWNDITFNTGMIIFISTIFVFLFLFNLRGPEIHKNMIRKWEKDIDEFNEYIK